MQPQVVETEECLISTRQSQQRKHRRTSSLFLESFDKLNCAIHSSNSFDLNFQKSSSSFQFEQNDFHTNFISEILSLKVPFQKVEIIESLEPSAEDLMSPSQKTFLSLKNNLKFHPRINSIFQKNQVFMYKKY